ncbi:MAG: hypothetical protein GY814_14320 [Gammaproteobacteria bacterium]|nr:hypothetical protein [Gammaproteobacteria bacterium]
MHDTRISEIEAIFVKAEQLRESGNTEEALQEYTKVVYFAPRHWPAYFHLGVLFGLSGHHELAVSLLHRSAALNPDNPVIKNHLSDFLMKLGRNDDALEFLKASWVLDSSYKNTPALSKIGTIYWERNLAKKAIHYFDLALEDYGVHGIQKEIEDTMHVSRWLRGLCRLSLGDYQAAWDDYESRVNVPGVFNLDLTGDKWSGQSLKGKTIFFAFEQRFGDFIQFIRFLPRLKAMGADIIVQVPIALMRQARHSIADVELISEADPIPDYDYHQLITSVPAVLNLSKEDVVKDTVAYLDVADQDKITDLPVRSDTFLKVGLVWAGQPDPDRSIPLTQYIPLLKHLPVSFFSFQLGERQNDLQNHAAGWLIHDLAPSISDFYDSSVLLKDMDLLITIDTAIAHQAGALGIPVWVMLRFFSDWRWETDRDDNIWYPSMRLFRQKYAGSWVDAGKQLELAFDKWVARSLKVKGIMLRDGS